MRPIYVYNYLLIMAVFHQTCVEFNVVVGDWQTFQNVKKLAKMWSVQIGKELFELSQTMSRKERVVDSFAVLQDKIYRENGATLVEDVARDIRILMENKVSSVKRIAEYAEFLSYHRNNDTSHMFYPNSTYNYFNADKIQYSQPVRAVEEELQEDIRYAECEWWCHQKDLPPLSNNVFDKIQLDKLFELRNKHDVGKECDCDNPPDRTQTEEYYSNLPLYDNSNNPLTKTNYNLSIVKLPANVYDRAYKVLEGVRWSEALDLIFKDNQVKDPTLKYQYFASPDGFMRHYPALQWSQESYDRTYDFRTRSWYTEALTCPKDVVILLDRSGSMQGRKRRLSAHIVNNILDTLNDNDFVTVYTFTNTTEPLVPCFEDRLVQANEENLRLLRESLTVYDIKFVADISLGLEKAFDILEGFRKNGNSSRCNQAIMLITEGLDYPFDLKMFEQNRLNNTPVRIFTYLLGTDELDSRNMEWIACANMGYFVNSSLLTEVREKMLNYMNVMSRPINYAFDQKQTAIWSYLYVDLADRRYSNWLWRKFEGIRQRQVFLDHAKREFQRLGKVLTSSNHMLLHESHEYEKYEIKHDYDYMTTVSLPVYGRRDNEVNLIGVAGIDVPISLLYSLVPHHKLGVNGYAFILTNNGYILMHPEHRREFENIPKPTFNRVDLLEVEILDDLSEPRLFANSIVELREKIVHRQKGYIVLKVKTAIDNMRRVILSKRRYYYTEIGPFSFGIALPDKYGLMIVNNSQITSNYKLGLMETKNWRIHPDWVYCKECGGRTSEENVLNCLRIRKKCRPLFASLLFDAYVTRWFEESINNENYYIKKHFVSNVFVATQSGLTRWRTFEKTPGFDESDEINRFEIEPQRAIDEDWYKRAAEDNYHNEDMFIYSVPFDISGYENNTMITSTSAVFVEDSRLKTPVSVVGLQFNHRSMYEIYNTITNKCNKSAETHYFTCVILDNNAYVVLADEIEYTGRYIGDIRPDIMYHLIKNGVYKSTRMFDYQAICYKLPPVPQSSSTATILQLFCKHIFQLLHWTWLSILLILDTVYGGAHYQSIKEDTLAYERLEIKKTFPTPCDHEMWLFTMGNNFGSGNFTNKTSKFDCSWPYVIEKIPNSNLLFLVINELCKVDTTFVYSKSPTPMEIVYNETLPCYIATHNNYTRRIYMNCFNRDNREDNLNNISKAYCGHTWD